MTFAAVSRAARRAHVATQAELLALEADATAALVAVAASVLAGHSNRSRLALVAASQALEVALRDALRVRRRRARVAGYTTLQAELAVALEDARRAGHTLPTGFRAADLPFNASVESLAPAESAAAFTAFWLTRATRDADEGRSLEATTSAVGYRLEAAAGAETTEAFGAERELQFLALAGLGLGVPFHRIWDARLDSCPRCKALDGTTRPLGIAWPADVKPGAVHRRCRCLATLIVAALPRAPGLRLAA